ncbi:MAG: glutaredoxin family protein [Gammaproteobacteria bacterium]|nr:glutaredoxin family protein [Gammaproteobacteria bacterium]
MTRFSVYIRHGCHLCDDLLGQLQQLQGEYHFDFQTIDVDSSPELAQQYGTLVPVVMSGDREICHYFLDQAGLIRALSDT